MSIDEDARSNELTKKTNKKASNEPQPFDKQDPREPVEVKEDKSSSEQDTDK